MRSPAQNSWNDYKGTTSDFYMNNIKKITLSDKIFTNTFIVLDKEFQKAVFKKLFSTFDAPKLVKLSGISKSLLRDWVVDRRSIRFTPFRKLCKSINILEEELLSKILFFRTRLSAGQIKLKKQIIIDNSFAELIGFTKGDGCMHKKYVELANDCLDTVFYYTNTLVNKFGLNKSQIEVTIMIPPNSSHFPELETEYSKSQGYKRIKVRSRKLHSRKPTIRCRINSKVLAMVFQQIKSNLYTILENSPKNIQQSFIRGYAAAEGSVTGRRIALCQHNVKELFFLQRILLNLRYSSVKSFSKNMDKERICIYGQADIHKYYKKIGFGPNKKRNDKLKTLVKSYVRSVYVPKQKNYAQIVRIISTNGFTTSTALATNLKKSYKETSRLLKDMTNTNVLTVDKKHKPYIYSLSKNNYGNPRRNF